MKLMNKRESSAVRAANRSVLALSAALLAAMSPLLATSACSSSSSSASNATDGAVDDGTVGGDDAAVEAGLGVGSPCDPIKQDCAVDLKCTYIHDAQNKIVPACEAPSQQPLKNDGEDCSRTKTGFDDCARGLACLPSPSGYTCRKLCSADSDCASAAKCAATTTSGRQYGTCFPTCAPFGNDCPGGTCGNAFYDNDNVNTLETCRAIGAGDAGAPCSVGSDCAANMNCRGASGSSLVCLLQCDSTHPCATGTCVADQGLANGAGLCE